MTQNHFEKLYVEFEMSFFWLSSIRFWDRDRKRPNLLINGLILHSRSESLWKKFWGYFQGKQQPHLQFFLKPLNSWFWQINTEPILMWLMIFVSCLLVLAISQSIFSFRKFAKNPVELSAWRSDTSQNLTNCQTSKTICRQLCYWHRN